LLEPEDSSPLQQNPAVRSNEDSF